MRYLLVCFILLFVQNQNQAQNLDFKIKKSLVNNAKVECLLLSRDEKMLISADHAGDIKLWSIPEGDLIYTIKAHEAPITSIALNRIGTKLVSTGYDGKVKLWSLPSGKLISSFDTPYAAMSFVDISHDDKTIYLAGFNYDNKIIDNAIGLSKIDVYTKRNTILFDQEFDKTERTKETSIWKFNDGAIDPTGQFLVFVKGYYIYFWNLKTEKIANKFFNKFELSNLLVSSNDNIYLWGTGLIGLREKNRDYQATHTTAGTDITVDYYSHLNLSKSGKYLVTGSDKNNINIWSSDNLSKLKTLAGHNGLVQVALFAKNDSILISGAYDGKIIFWENETPKVEEQKPNEIATEVKNNNNNVVNNRKDTISAPAENPKSSNTVFADKNIPTSVYGRPVEMQSEITINKPKIDLKVWDEYSEDGDIISISLNGEWVLQNYMLKKDAKIVSIDLKEGNNYLVLYAHNLGEVPPNSAAISTEVNNKEYKLTISSDLKTNGALNIIYSTLNK